MSSALCPVCATRLTVPPRESQKYDATIYDCANCGRFLLSDYTKHIPGFDESRGLIGAWIRQQHRLGDALPFVAKDATDSSWFESLKGMGFPQSVDEKLDALLEAYAEIVETDYGKVVRTDLFPQVITSAAAKDIDEVRGLNQFLVERDYVWTEPSHRNRHIRITAKGWSRIAELSDNSNSATPAPTAETRVDAAVNAAAGEVARREPEPSDMHYQAGAKGGAIPKGLRWLWRRKFLRLVAAGVVVFLIGLVITSVMLVDRPVLPSIVSSPSPNPIVNTGNTASITITATPDF